MNESNDTQAVKLLCPQVMKENKGNEMEPQWKKERYGV